ncbi:MAG: DpnD/PcfM family protein [Bacteroidales bacterium]|nr:DpnD/PcfM family protein [Bacteroidales bacterium]
METFKIEIKETLATTINIEAENQSDAILKVERMYRNQEVVLDAEDYCTTEIKEISQSTSIMQEILSNGDNFYMIEKEYIYFWGLNIQSEKFKIDKKAKKYISSQHFDLNEVCEFNQKEDFELFKLFH